MWATLDLSPRDIDVRDGTVYVTTENAEDENLTGSIVAIPTASPTPKILARNQRAPHQVAAGGGFVYWLASPNDDGAVMRVPVAGGTPVKIAATFILSAAALTATDDAVYWVNLNKLMRAKHKDAKPEQIAVVGDHGDSSRALAVYKDRAYFVNQQTLWEVKLSAKTFLDIARGPALVFGIAVDDDGIFWSDRGDITTTAGNGEVRKILYGSKQADVVQAGVRLPWGVATDEQFVYWVSNKDREGTIWRAQKKGSHVQSIATGQDAPVDVAVDARAVYWTNASSKTVMRLPK